MKKAVVIGAGITGIATALYLKEKKFDVEIYEASKDIGGILRDTQFDQNLYFTNCQYLNTNSKWMELFFNDQFYKHFLSFEHTYTSYTDLFDKTSINHEYAMPVSEQIINIPKIEKNKKIKSINERFSFYGPSHKKALINFSSKYFKDISKLHHSFVYPTQLSRLYFKNLKEVINVKKTSKIVNELFGLPRSKLSIKNELKSSIPVNGYNNFFNDVENFLEKLNIKVFCSKPIKPVLNNYQNKNPVSLFYKNEKIKADLIVWCSNPTPLIKVCKFGILDNPFTKFKSIYLKANHDYKIDKPHYIQVFSKKTNITRIYMYPLINKNVKLTIEKIEDKNDFNKDIDSTKDILQKCNFDVKIKFENHYSNQKRHILYTYEDLKKFRKMDDFVNNKNFICGAWTKYGRDEKINYIYKKIDELL
tara:strand:- start:6368 stop:7624 length:1257 start_codon:yes stop_codon:yes gene_type:complete